MVPVLESCCAIRKRWLRSTPGFAARYLPRLLLPGSTPKEYLGYAFVREEKLFSLFCGIYDAFFVLLGG